jgi:hypothetical protein
MPAPHDTESAPQHPGFIDDNYRKESTVIVTEYNIPQDGDPQENSFFNDQGWLESTQTATEWVSTVQVGSWDEFLFEKPPSQSCPEYRQLRHAGQLHRSRVGPDRGMI